MLPRLLLKSLKNRPGRALLVIVALVMGVSLEAALLNLALEVGGKSSAELKAYGANVLLLPGENTALPEAGSSPAAGEFIPQSRLAALDRPGDDLEGYAPFLYGLVAAGGQDTVLMGTWFDRARAISPWWDVKGEAPERGSTSALVGTELAGKLSLKAGDSFLLETDGREQNLTITGILSTGSSEDNQVLVDLGLAQSLLNLPGQVSAVQVSVPTDKQTAEAAATALEEEVPGARAKTLRQVAEAEEAVVGKVNLLMGMVAVLILLVAGLTVSAALTNAVIERRRDIGLMRSLGAESRRIAAIMLSEIMLLGAVAGPAGYLLGLAAAQAVGLSVFGTTVSPHFLAVPAVLATSLVLALLAALVPVRQALAVKPAVTLRGE